ncbi:M23 family metallopeptidase [Anaerovorax odorimutans]|uniref:M23 family metallopeptidase n=1 Tax=Anaerovorax odorimutans TaxID=109327 RepID=UPI0004206C57|nr:M23 family metallopeptidase [Anaerovorax odorimutans]
MNRYRGNSRRKNLGSTVIKQVIACIIIVLLAILIKKMDIAIVNNTVETFKAELKKDYNTSEIVATTKGLADKVKGLPVSITAAFNKGEEKLAFSPPTDGAQVISTFGEKSTYFGGENSGFSRGMTFASDEDLQIFSVSGGTVEEVSESSDYGKYIKIKHENGISSIYGGCTQIYVKPLDKVKKGQLIAYISKSDNGQLKFELWDNGNVVNPNNYIEF